MKSQPRSSVHSLGPGPNRRELRVEGLRGAESGFWHKDLVGDAWEFTPTGASLLGTLIENAPTDRSTDTLSPAAPWHLSTRPCPPATVPSTVRL